MLLLVAGPQPPTMVDAATERLPCRPGGWGSDTSCATHEGQPLDKDGKCFWGQAPGPLERAMATLLAEEPAGEGVTFHANGSATVVRGSTATRYAPGPFERIEDFRTRVLAEREPDAPSLHALVLAELARMVGDAGGSCVLYRKPPAVPREVHAEINRLCRAEPGFREPLGLAVYCFNREASDVLADVVKGLGR